MTITCNRVIKLCHVALLGQQARIGVLENPKTWITLLNYLETMLNDLSSTLEIPRTPGEGSGKIFARGAHPNHVKAFADCGG